MRRWKTTTKLLLMGLLFCSLTLSFAGCKSQALRSEQQGKTEGQTIIVTSFYPMYILTQNLCTGIDDVQIINMTPPQTGCLHDYQLTPDDMKTLEQADILVINGAGMESFMDKVSIQQKDLAIVEASQGVPLLKDGHGEDNPHVWLSIELYEQQVENAARGLAKADPAHAEQYQANARAYQAKLEELRTHMHQELNDIEERNIATFHEAFPYFAREFDLNIVTVISREPGSEPSAEELAQTVKAINSAGVKALFAEPQYSDRAAQAIARETGARVYTLDPIVSGPDDKDAYIQIMKENVQTLKEALQ